MSEARFMRHRCWGVVLALAGLGGCGGTPLIPAETIQLTSATSFTSAQLASTLFIAGAIYIIYDPLAPNWQVEQVREPARGSAAAGTTETFRFVMKMKRYHTGGAGEAMMILRRQAAQLQQKLGYGAYQITAYEEGIESHTLGAQRYVQAAVQLTDKLAVPMPLPVPAAPAAAVVPEKSVVPEKTTAVAVPVLAPEIRQAEVVPARPLPKAEEKVAATVLPESTSPPLKTPSVVPVRVIPAPAPKSMPKL